MRTLGVFQARAADRASVAQLGLFDILPVGSRASSPRPSR
jgi:hypothetical protein